MRMKHTVRFHSGAIEVYEFPTKKASDKALDRAYASNFQTIRCIDVEPVNYPWRRYRIDF